jgi:hypothetical protein
LTETLHAVLGAMWSHLLPWRVVEVNQRIVPAAGNVIFARTPRYRYRYLQGSGGADELSVSNARLECDDSRWLRYSS